MSPTAFYCWLYEQPLMWLGLKRWQPRPEQNFPIGIVLCFPPAIALWTLAGGRLFLAGGILLFLIGLLLLIGLLFHSAFALLAWNQRAARLRSQGGAVPAPPARWQRWTLGPIYLLLIGLITPLAVLTGIENVRGALAWREAREALVAKGERLTFQELLPTPVPPEQNFASLPLFANVFDYSRPKGGAQVSRDPDAQKRFWVLNLPDGFLPKRKPDDRSPLTLAEWSVAFRGSISNRTAKPPKANSDEAWEPAYAAAEAGASPGRVVLTALSVADPMIRDVCEASQRPHARFPIHWEESFNALLPHLASGKAFSRQLSLRVQARLAEGDVAGAFADQQCNLRVAEMLREEPLLISQLVRIAQAAIAGTAVWPGIQNHQWTEPQLAELQRAFEGRDYLGSLAWAMEGERAGAIMLLDQMVARAMSNPLALTNPDAAGAAEGFSPLGLLFPRGWIRQNEVRIAAFDQRMIEFGRALATNAPADGWSRPLREFREETQRSVQVAPNPHNILYRMLVPALDKAMMKAARANQTAAFAAVACALERHWRKHGAYPESLAALAPEFMARPPRDLMDGQPLRYARTAEGFFRLWSVGLDGVDDGGVARKKDSGSDEKGLDWVWPN